MSNMIRTALYIAYIQRQSEWTDPKDNISFDSKIKSFIGSPKTLYYAMENLIQDLNNFISHKIYIYDRLRLSLWVGCISISLSIIFSILKLDFCPLKHHI